MKQLIILFVTLFGGFLGTWIYKIETPVNRPDEYAEGYNVDAGAWWNTGAVEVDDSWRLDPEIPLNYMPVPGENELYMVVDNDGLIIGYRKRTRQIDGSWLWEDVNPDIPDDYEPVEGLEDVYRVTASDGNISYYKYVRNEDDTYAFVEVDENGKAIGKNRDATTIDGRHVHITGNIYSELNDYGVVIGYDKRIQNEDGTFSWIETQMPNISVTGGSLSLPGTGSDVKYQDGENGGVKYPNANGYQGGETGAPESETGLEPYQIPSQGGIVDVTPNTPTIINNSDGTHTEIEVVRETKNIDGWTSTYETTVKRTYDADGNLLTTYSDGPYEVDTKQNITSEAPPVQGDTKKKENTLDKEVVRVTGGYTYRNDIEGEVVALLNAQRVDNGLSTIKVTDTATQIAKLRAADMAGYDTSKEDLPTYGFLGNMLSDYGVSSTVPGENLWKSTIRTAADIHTRFQTLASARTVRMEEDAKQYGIAVVEKNGYLYICEIILN